MLRKVVRAGSVLLLVSAVTAAGASQTRWEEQVEDQLDAVLARIGSDFDAVSEILIGELEPGDTDGFEVDLVRGVEYLIVGVCDADCSDIDLAVYDEDDDLVDADTESDDAPVIQFEAYANTTVWVEVSMAGCYADTCAHGVQAYAR